MFFSIKIDVSALGFMRENRRLQLLAQIQMTTETVTPELGPALTSVKPQMPMKHQSVGTVVLVAHLARDKSF